MKNFESNKREHLMYIGFILLGIAMAIWGWYDIMHKVMFGDYRDLFFGLMFICEGGIFGLGALPYVIPNWTYPRITNNVSKELKSFLIELPSLGLINISLGMIFAFIIFTDTFQEDWVYAMIPVKILGLLLVYLFLKILPGGYPMSRRLNFGYYASKYYEPDQEEKRFDQLVNIYKNEIFTLIPIALFFITDFLVGFPKYHTGGINSDGIFGFIFLTIMSVGFICGGVRYLSAWWNLRTAFKEKPAQVEKLLNTTIPEVRVKLNLPPKIIKTLIKFNIVDQKKLYKNG